MYFLDNRAVYRREVTDRGVNDTYVGPSRKPEFEAPKKTLSVGEPLAVSLSWVKFNVNTGNYEPDKGFWKDFQVEVSTDEGDFISGTVVPFGEAFEFLPDKPGVYHLNATGDGAGSNMIEISVQPILAAPSPAPTELSRLETQNLILMDALATVYVETLGDKADDQTLTDLYTPLVEAGRKTVEHVPEKIKNAVQDRVSAKGDGGVKDAN